MKAGHITPEIHHRIVVAWVDLLTIGNRLTASYEVSKKVNPLLPSDDLALEVNLDLNIDTIKDCIDRLQKLAEEFEQLKALPD